MSSVVSSEWHLELSNHLVYSTNYGCIYLYVGSIILLLQCSNFRSRSFISIHCKYGTRASFRSFRIIQLILSDVGRANGFFAIAYAVSREACIRMRTTRSFGKAVKVENVKLAATRAILRKHGIHHQRFTCACIYTYISSVSVGISSCFRATVIKRSIRDYTRAHVAF